MQRSLIYFLSCSGLIILAALVATSGIDSYFNSGDESGYFLNLSIIDQYGISTAFLQHFSGAAGPLHPVLHWILRPLTGGVPPYVRWVNLTFLVFFLVYFRKSVGWKIMWIPMTFVCAGYAMTEFPALFFLLLALHLLWFTSSNRFIYIKYLLSGICMSLAIAGRLYYLSVLPFFYLALCLDYYRPKSLTFLSYDTEKKPKNHVWAIVIFVLSSLILPSWIIYAWGGLASPEVKAFGGHNTFDVNWSQIFPSACFAFLLVFILYPKAILALFSYKKWIICLALVVLFGNIIFPFYSFVPAKSVWEMLAERFSISLLLIESIVGLLFGSLSILLTLLFLYILYYLIKINNFQLKPIFFVVCTAVLVVSAIKMTTIFSSRYPYQALPFLMFLFREEKMEKVGLLDFFIALTGMGWGIMTWFAYQTIY